MKDNYDFSKGIKNPYADKLKQGYSVTIHYDFSGDNESIEETKEPLRSEDLQPQKQG